MAAPHKPGSDTGTDNDTGSGLNPWLRYSGLGLQFAVSIALGVALGYLADRQLGLKTPWLTILGALVGTAAAITLVIRATNPKKNNNPNA